jgi:thiamine transport system ATP-binding protein
VLDVRDVTIGFEGRPLLDRVSLHLDPGDVVALLGPSGSGKSTLLRIIAGLIDPERGSVHIDGVDMTTVPTHRRSVGMVFQDEQLFPHLSVSDNVGFGLKMAGVPKGERKQRCAEMLELVGLSGFGDRQIDRLSGGEAKRVALARSLAPTPKVLLLDEPLTGLDRDLHDRLALDVAAILRSTGTTALWVTHDPAEATTVADRVVRLSDEVGHPDDDRPE